jgi:replicative DNA helicase
VSNRTDPEFASERALIGAAIWATDLASAVVEAVKPAYLREPAHRRILELVEQLVGRGEPVSPSIVLAGLAKAKALIAGLDGSYLHTLVEERALPGQIGWHATEVKAKAWKWRLWQLGTRCQQASENLERTPEEDAELLQLWLDEAMGADSADHGTAQAADLVFDVLDEIEQGTDHDVVPTGFSDLDALMSIRPGQLIVVGARPGVGKTVFAMDVARHVGIRLKEPVYFLTLEMPRNELMKRMISAESKVSLHSILHHRLNRPLLSDSDWDRINPAKDRILQSSITIDDSPGAGLARVGARLRHLKRTTGIRVAMIDYLGIMSTSGRPENRQQAVADLTRGLKQIAREIGIPIFLLAQLNRQVMGRQDRRPMASDLKDSGAIEADADAVVLLHREDVFDKESPRAGEADFIVDKNRSGPTSTITVAFQGHYSRFVDMATDSGQPPAGPRHLRPVP